MRNLKFLGGLTSFAVALAASFAAPAQTLYERGPLTVGRSGGDCTMTFAAPKTELYFMAMSNGVLVLLITTKQKLRRHNGPLKLFAQGPGEFAGASLPNAEYDGSMVSASSSKQAMLSMLQKVVKTGSRGFQILDDKGNLLVEYQVPDLGRALEAWRKCIRGK